MVAVEDVSLGSTGMTILDEHLFNGILHFFHGRQGYFLLFLQVIHHFGSQSAGGIHIVPAHRLGSLVDGRGDLFDVKWDHPPIAFLNGIEWFVVQFSINRRFFPHQIHCVIIRLDGIHGIPPM